MWCKAHKIRPTTRDAAPMLLVTVGVQSQRSALADAAGGSPSVFGRGHVCWSRRKKLGWSGVTHAACEDWEQVWAELDGCAKGRKRVYIVSSNALDDLTLLHFWSEVEKGRCDLGKANDRPVRVPEGGAKLAHRASHPLVFGDRCDIIGFSRGHTNYRWVSVTNWADLSLSDMAAHVGHPVPTDAIALDKWRAHGWPAEDQAVMMHAYMQQVMTWWVKQECGTWRDTPGAAAWSTFTRQGGDTGFLKHEHEASLILEDRAAFGGRASAFYCGPIGDPVSWGELSDAPSPRPTTGKLLGQVHRYDVRSMYPTLLRDRQYPVKLIDHRTDLSVQHLKYWLDGSCVVAAVRLRTDEPEYPLRGEEGPIYPTGQFDTVLTSPELERAISRGHLLRVYEASLYKSGRPFEKWASWALALRSAPDTKSSPARELFVKTLANALSGRLGRKRVGWHDAAGVVPLQWWGQWLFDDGAQSTPTLYRAVCGRVQRNEHEDYRPGTLGACYAHLTAYGRVLMADLRERVGHDQVLWQDTDGLMVTNAGRARLLTQPEYHPNRFGHLRHEVTATHGQITTAKHYWLDGRWTLAGIATGFTFDVDGKALELRTANPVRRAQDPVAHATYQFAQAIDLSKIEPGVTVGDDGWTVPPRVWVGERPIPEPEPEPGVLPFFAYPHEQRSYLLPD